METQSGYGPGFYVFHIILINQHNRVFFEGKLKKLCFLQSVHHSDF